MDVSKLNQSEKRASKVRQSYSERLQDKCKHIKSLSDLRILDALSGGGSIKSVCKDTGILAPALSRKIPTLEREGLIVSTVSRFDNRVTDIRITAKAVTDLARFRGD